MFLIETMKRRKAIQALAASWGAALTLPAWANAWTPLSLGTSTKLLNISQSALLTDIVSTIIPEGAIQGAASLGVPAFVEKMVADCYEQPVQASFKAGLDALDVQAQATYSQPFTNLQTDQRTALLMALQQTDKTEQKEFFSLLKNLTIQGYTTSEYVMVNHLKYTMAPGHYYGCVAV